MKLFALLAVLFFAFRAFSQTFNYFYIDEYVRAQEDKNYQAYLQQQIQDQKIFRLGVEEYKEEKISDLQTQEKSRRDYSDWKKSLVVKTFEKEEIEYEKEKQKDLNLYLALEKKYAQTKANETQQAPNYLNRNSRMIASLETRKFISKKDRKFHFKNETNRKNIK